MKAAAEKASEKPELQFAPSGVPAASDKVVEPFFGDLETHRFP